MTQENFFCGLVSLVQESGEEDPGIDLTTYEACLKLPFMEIRALCQRRGVVIFDEETHMKTTNIEVDDNGNPQARYWLQLNDSKVLLVHIRQDNQGRQSASFSMFEPGSTPIRPIDYSEVGCLKSAFADDVDGSFIQNAMDISLGKVRVDFEGTREQIKEILEVADSNSVEAKQRFDEVKGRFAVFVPVSQDVVFNS